VKNVLEKMWQAVCDISTTARNLGQSNHILMLHVSDLMTVITMTITHEERQYKYKPLK
jgi:hypothetical protein